MKTQSVTVQCDHGLHLRIAARVSEIARQSGTSVHIRCAGCPKADACSVIQLLMLGAAAGTPLEIEAEGTDEKEDAVLRALTDVFDQGGGI